MDVESVLCLLRGNHCCVSVFEFCELLVFFCVSRGRSLRFAWRMGDVNILPLPCTYDDDRPSFTGEARDLSRGGNSPGSVPEPGG